MGRLLAQLGGSSSPPGHGAATCTLMERPQRAVGEHMLNKTYGLRWNCLAHNGNGLPRVLKAAALAIYFLISRERGGNRARYFMLLAPAASRYQVKPWAVLLVASLCPEIPRARRCRLRAALGGRVSGTLVSPWGCFSTWGGLRPPSACLQGEGTDRKVWEMKQRIAWEFQQQRVQQKQLALLN